MDDHLQKLAALAVRVGANVQPGQIVGVACSPGKEPLTRAIAAEAYRAGAKFVDVAWFDPWVKRARVEHAPEDSLEFVPEWYGHRILQMGEERAATIAITGAQPGVLDGVDPVRAGRDKLPALKESSEVLSKQQLNWTVVPGPTQDWADLVYPDDPDALTKLWDAIVHICRLDEPDPAAAWQARGDELLASASRLTDRGFDALHYEGPGTDLTIGLLPGHRWAAGAMQTVDGIRHMPNLPTEETFTSPDPERTDGVVAATLPLMLRDGTMIRDLVVHFEGGRMTELTASSGQDVLRTLLTADDGAVRLGEVALVDGSGRIGALGTVFHDTLLDENAASHIAFGVGFPDLIDAAAAERVNRSEIHLDFMIGSPELTVTGVAADGTRTPVLAGGEWQL